MHGFTPIQDSMKGKQIVVVQWDLATYALRKKKKGNCQWYIIPGVSGPYVKNFLFPKQDNRSAMYLYISKQG